MRYVILRDDDTNALTPVECLDRLYRPFLNRGLPVNLAVIPDVSLDARTPEGRTEGFLKVNSGDGNEGLESREPRASDLEPAIHGVHAQRAVEAGCSVLDPECPRRTAPITENRALVHYLRDNPQYRIVQHGCHHDTFEFDREAPAEIAARLDRGMRLLIDAGFPRPLTFVAPHDKLSRASYREVARRFRVLSTGWFELRRLPATWWPGYLLKKARHAAHWRVGHTTLLSHPGCLLSCHRDYGTMLDEIVRTIASRPLTVLVTHWWEYFRDGQADERLIHRLHETAGYLATQPDVKVISFADLANGGVPLN